MCMGWLTWREIQTYNYIIQTALSINFWLGINVGVTSCSGCLTCSSTKRPLLTITIISNFNCTMLQKLSKCEVKHRLCWYLIILPPLQFYVKFNFGEFKWSKNVNFDNFRGSEFWFLVNLGLESCSNLLEIKIQNL